MSLRHTYTVIAPLYDILLATAGTSVRAASLRQIPYEGNLNILIDGIGIGLDLPHLPLCHYYTGLNLATAMLSRAKPRIGNLRLKLVQGRLHTPAVCSGVLRPCCTTSDPCDSA